MTKAELTVAFLAAGFLGLAVLALVFVAGAADFGAATFGAAALGAAVFFGAAAAFLGAALALVAVAFAAGFCGVNQSTCSSDVADRTHTFAAGAFALVSVLAATGFSAAGFLSSFFASLVGPEGPLGRRKSPASSPDCRALLMSVLICFSVEVPSLLLAMIYFLIA
jgi:hypothetical protein